MVNYRGRQSKGWRLAPSHSLYKGGDTMNNDTKLLLILITAVVVINVTLIAATAYENTYNLVKPSNCEVLQAYYEEHSHE